MDSNVAPAGEEVCFVNIGPRERANRMRFGVAALVLAVALAVLMIERGAAVGYRALLFLPLFVAGVGIFQAREKT